MFKSKMSESGLNELHLETKSFRFDWLCVCDHLIFMSHLKLRLGCGISLHKFLDIL